MQKCDAVEKFKGTRDASFTFISASTTLFKKDCGEQILEIDASL